MQEKDLDAVHSLLQRYLNRFDIAPILTQEECKYWLLHKKDSIDERAVWSYVIEVTPGLTLS